MKKTMTALCASLTLFTGAVGLGCGFAALHPMTAMAAQTAAAAAQTQVHAQGMVVGAQIASDLNTIRLHATMNNTDMSNTDGKVYLFEMHSWDRDLANRTDPLAVLDPAADLNTSVPLNRGAADDRSFSAFSLAVKAPDGYRLISNRLYLTNPEVLATDQTPLSIRGKKGLSVEFTLLDDALGMGIDQAEINIPVNFCRGSGIDYEYQGKHYSFNASWLATYDKTIKKLSDSGMAITAVILNGWNDATPNMFRPGQKKTNDNYYTFTAETKDNAMELEAMASFLAERYNGRSGHGRISNWVVGNEINNQFWNHAGAMALDDYVTLYQRAFRVFYTAVKRQNAHSNVLFSIDYYWNNNAETNGKTYYKGRDLLDAFNRIGILEGQFDWGLAYHPYPYPMNDPVFWDDAKNGLTDNADTPVLNFYNLHVLTDYLQKPEMLSPLGKVRHVFLTEQGFTSTTPAGEKLKEQAAAYAYSYYLVMSNPYIEGYNLARQIDAPAEVNTGISFGLFYCDMSKPNDIIAYHSKPIYYVFRDIDKAGKSLKVSADCKKTLGISKWSELIPNFIWSGME